MNEPSDEQTPDNRPNPTLAEIDRYLEILPTLSEGKKPETGNPTAKTFPEPPVDLTNSQPPIATWPRKRHELGPSTPSTG